MAGPALGDIHLGFAWQAWHLWHWAGSGGAFGRAWARLGALGHAWARLVAGDDGDAAVLSVAGVALGDIHLLFAWQVWHLETSTYVSRGRRGTYGTGLALVARLDPPYLTQHLSHTTLSHTIFDTPHCHAPSLTHHLSHTIFDTPSFTPLCHTPSFTHNFVTHTHHLSHTIFHTPLCHPPSLTHHLSHTNFHTPSFTHHFVTHHLSHTIFDTPSFTPLCHTPSFTHRHRRSFTHHLSRTTLCHTILHHSILHTPLCHTPSFTTPSFTHNFVTHHVSHATLSHTHTQLCFTSRSSTTSFVFPSFPVPATTLGAHYWKKLLCGVFRSFNFSDELYILYCIFYVSCHSGYNGEYLPQFIEDPQPGVVNVSRTMKCAITWASGTMNPQP